MDKRIKKTRKNIQQVFLQLLEEKGIGEITAQEIAALADISRSTFYQHYTDVYNLLDQAEDEIFSDISALLEGYTYQVIQEDPLRLFTELFFYFRRNSKICVVLLHKNGSITTGHRISKMIQEKFRHEWESLLGCDDPVAARYLSQYVITGFVGILQEWIAQGMQESEEDMALIARVFINSTISNHRENQRQHLKGDTEMSTFKDKIRQDARGFAGGVLGDTSAFLNEKSTEIQQKVEAGLSIAGSRLSQRGEGLKEGRSTADNIERKRQKLLKKQAELEEKFQEKAAKLAKEGKDSKLAEEREKYGEELEKLHRQLAELDTAE